MTFALLMALFVAVAVAATQSDLLAEPLANLAQATQAIARGDFSRRAPVTSRDELGVLTESFNSMTRQLEDARHVVEINRAALEAAKAHLENILANLSAGVLVFDHALQLTISNHGAHEILGAELDTFGAQMRERFVTWRRGMATRSFAEGWHAGHARARAAQAPAAVLVVSTTSASSSRSQRATLGPNGPAPRARDQNRYTPIQLSAERLEMNRGGGLCARTPKPQARHRPSSASAALKRWWTTKRLPRPAAPAPSRWIGCPGARRARLYETPACRARSLAVICRGLGRRRAATGDHNLVQSAQDSLENAKHSGAVAAIEVRTELAGDKVRLAVSDNGGGFPEELMARIFEPYVSTKRRGTGLGLAIVKKIVDEHHGSVAIENRPSRGASVRGSCRWRRRIEQGANL